MACPAETVFAERIGRRRVVRPAGLEPATPGLGNRCSILLSYGRSNVYAVLLRFALVLPCWTAMFFGAVTAASKLKTASRSSEGCASAYTRGIGCAFAA
jgi:hypothetical protein